MAEKREITTRVPKAPLSQWTHTYTHRDTYRHRYIHVHDYITIYKYTAAATSTTDGATTMTNGKNKLIQKILVFPCHAQAEAATAAAAAHKKYQL